MRLRVRDTRGRLDGDAATRKAVPSKKASAGPTPLPPPDLTIAPPQSRSGPTGYTPTDKETTGWELVRRLLASDAEGLHDLRAQRGLGADALDELGRFFELKVSGGPEPDSVRLEPSEIRRAMETDDFILVVVSEVESTSGRHPKIRIIPSPLQQLEMQESSAVRLNGIRGAHSLIYEFEPEGEE